MDQTVEVVREFFPNKLPLMIDAVVMNGLVNFETVRVFPVCPETQKILEIFPLKEMLPLYLISMNRLQRKWDDTKSET